MENPAHFAAAGPRLPAGLKLLKPAQTLRDDDCYSDCLIDQHVFSGEARHVSFARARLRNIRFEATLRCAEFEDVSFENCDLSNVDFSESYLSRVVFLNCRMTGVNFSGAVIKDAAAENSALKYANFHFAHLSRASFTACNCRDADFGEADFSKIRFAQTDLRKAQMSGTVLTGIDFTSCDIDGLGARPGDLRGAVFSPEQAVVAAQIIGIVIRYP